jgi:hypothetical protein
MNIGTGRRESGKFLGPFEVRCLIQAHQSGDRSAGDTLFRAYRPLLKRRCAEFRALYPWLEWDDLFSAAQTAFLKAIAGFNLSRNTGLAAYAQSKIKYALLDVLEDRYRNGTTGEGRVGRWLADNWDERKDLTPEEIAKATGCSVANAAEALIAEAALRDSGELYDTVGEGGYDYSTERLGPGVGYDGDPIAIPGDEPGDGGEDSEVDDPALADMGGLGADNPLDSETGDADSTDDDLDDDHGEGEAFGDDEDDEPDEQANGYRALDDTEWEHYCQQRATAKAQVKPGPYAKSFVAPLKPIGPRPEPIRQRDRSVPIFRWAPVWRPGARVPGPYVRKLRLSTFRGRAESVPPTAIRREPVVVPAFPWPAACECARQVYEAGQRRAFRHVRPPIFREALADARGSRSAITVSGSPETRALYDEGKATREARFDLDWETYEQDKAAGCVFRDGLWRVVLQPMERPPRVSRPKAKPEPKRKRSPVTHVLVTAGVARAALERIAFLIEYGRPPLAARQLGAATKRGMLPGRAEPLPDPDVRPPHPSRIRGKRKRVEEIAVKLAA